MSKIQVTYLSGETHTVELEPGTSLMETLRASETDAVLALCGGNCSCGTCHVVVDAEFFDRLPEMGEEEREMLENLPSFTETSRLSCQLPCDELPGGLKLRIPAADL